MTRLHFDYAIPHRATRVPWISPRSFVLFFLTLPLQTALLIGVLTRTTSTATFTHSLVLITLLTAWQVLATLVSLRSTRLSVLLTLPTLAVPWWFPSSEHALLTFIIAITWCTVLLRAIDLHENATRFHTWNVWWRLLVQLGYLDVRAATPIHAAETAATATATATAAAAAAATTTTTLSCEGDEKEGKEKTNSKKKVAASAEATATEARATEATKSSLRARHAAGATDTTGSNGNSVNRSGACAHHQSHLDEPPTLDSAMLRSYLTPAIVGSARVSIGILITAVLFSLTPVASVSPALHALLACATTSSSALPACVLAHAAGPSLLFALLRCTLAMVVFTLLLYQVDLIYIFFYVCIGVRPSLAMMDLHRAGTLRAFWGRHWNRSIHTMLRQHVFVRVHALTGSGPLSAFATFVGSGVLHAYPALVVGFGWRACCSIVAFFLAQCVLVFVELAVWGKRKGESKGKGNGEGNGNDDGATGSKKGTDNVVLSHSMFLVFAFLSTAPLIVEPFLAFFGL